MKLILILLCAVVAITTASPVEKESPVVEKHEANISKREDVDPVKKAEEIRIAQEKLRALNEARERFIEKQQLYLDSLYRQSIWNPYRVPYYQGRYIEPFLGLSPWHHY
ncbi:uncharacterized protein LOC109609422 [Aethina tumida]|uniref:uncharacterized protein LOC109609422 n=1 Tax=Aethina tumida TaxID=116153 RepID=UPI00096B430C|nr:uncharacterized protein LOC109609422 [Aethina tumida]